VQEDDTYNSTHRHYLTMASWALLVLVVVSPLYMEFEHAWEGDKYVVSDGQIEDLDALVFTPPFSGVKTFTIDKMGQATPIVDITETVVADGESRMLVYDLGLRHVQDPETYWRLKQKGALPHLDGRSKEARMSAYSFHHNNEETIKRIARQGDRNGEKACKLLGEYIEENFSHSQAVEFSLNTCFMN